MRIRPYLISLSAVLAFAAADTFAAPAAVTGPLKQINVISSSGARAMVDACTEWAQMNNVALAMAVLDVGGNIVSSQAMEGYAPNSIDTALLKAKNALRWRRPSSETAGIVRRGENMAPTYIMGDFPQPGAMPIIIDGQVVGSMGVSSGDGEKCAQYAIDKVFKGRTAAAGR